MHAAAPRPRSALRAFLSSEASGGVVLMGAAALALVVANSPVSGTYFEALHSYVLGLSVLHWVNDALIAVFFLLVGLEIKREMLDGQLSTWPRRILPGIAALGGMLVPAVIYLAFNGGPDGHPRGWAIPSATDIAFALGVLSLLSGKSRERSSPAPFNKPGATLLDSTSEPFAFGLAGSSRSKVNDLPWVLVCPMSIDQQRGDGAG